MSTESDTLREIVGVVKSIRARLRQRKLYDGTFDAVERAQVSEAIDNGDREIERNREAAKPRRAMVAGQRKHKEAGSN